MRANFICGVQNFDFFEALPSRQSPDDLQDHAGLSDSLIDWRMVGAG